MYRIEQSGTKKDHKFNIRLYLSYVFSISIVYNCFIELETQISLLKFHIFEMYEIIFFHSSLLKDIFNVVALGNVDHNPTSTTNKLCFNGTIRSFQNPIAFNLAVSEEGTDYIINLNTENKPFHINIL